jgi:hypothetical protein
MTSIKIYDRAELAEELDALIDADTYQPPAPLDRAQRDIKAAAAVLSTDEVKFLVDLYYTAQGYRITAAARVRRTEETAEPHAMLGWTFGAFETVEAEIKKALDVYTQKEPTGAGLWLRSVMGIGPVIGAGLLAHTRPAETETVGKIWAFAGLDPSRSWERGQKRPWNAALKVLCFHAGESFVKMQGRKADTYGKLYAQRKLYEIERNEAGDLAEQAAAMLTAKRIGKDTVAYQSYSIGKLPAAHIHARARRWTVKLFLSHHHVVGYYLAHHRLPPRPYVISHLGHVDEIAPPNMDLIDGLADAWEARPRD